MSAYKRHRTGSLGEKLAAEHLEKHGYTVLEKNYRCAEGEVDIIAMQGGCLVFVEVRTRTGRGFGSPEESVTLQKMARLRKAAARYAQEREGLPEQQRIDFVGVEMDNRGKTTRIEIIENAVEG